EAGIDGVRRHRRHQQRVAVRRRLGDHVGPDIAAGADAVFDGELLSHELAHASPHDARDDVGGTTGRERNDDADRFRRICVLRVGGGPGKAEHENGEQSISMVLAHETLPDLIRNPNMPRGGMEPLSREQSRGRAAAVGATAPHHVSLRITAFGTVPVAAKIAASALMSGASWPPSSSAWMPAVTNRQSMPSASAPLKSVRTESPMASTRPRLQATPRRAAHPLSARS